jgi:integrase
MVAYCHHVLYTALEEAMRFGLVLRNVADLVDPPRKPRREMAVYDEDQARKLIATASGDRFEALCVLVLATGMREGELLALRWSEVNLEKATVTVLATLQQYPGQRPSREETKTTHSTRVIALPQTVVRALLQHHQAQQEEQARLGAAWNANDLVFPNTIGNPMHASSFRTRWWRALVTKAGLPYIRFHDLRHTAATLLLGRGVPVKVVSEMLGHANVSITLNMYGHVLPHMQHQAAQTMDVILSGDAS